MKRKYFMGMGLLVLAGLPLTAGEHKVPQAPADYQSLKNPIEMNAGNVDRGKTLYHRKCKKCHGKDGDGHGPKSKTLDLKPMDWTKSGYLTKRSDGQLFWFTLTGGGDANSEMGAYGPGSDENMSKEDIWKIIAYMRKDFSK